MPLNRPGAARTIVTLEFAIKFKISSSPAAAVKAVIAVACEYRPIRQAMLETIHPAPPHSPKVAVATPRKTPISKAIDPAGRCRQSSHVSGPIAISRQFAQTEQVRPSRPI